MRRFSWLSATWYSAHDTRRCSHETHVRRFALVLVPDHMKFYIILPLEYVRRFSWFSSTRNSVELYHVKFVRRFFWFLATLNSAYEITCLLHEKCVRRFARFLVFTHAHMKLSRIPPRGFRTWSPRGGSKIALQLSLYFLSLLVDQHNHCLSPITRRTFSFLYYLVQFWSINELRCSLTLKLIDL